MTPAWNNWSATAATPASKHQGQAISLTVITGSLTVGGYLGGKSAKV